MESFCFRFFCKTILSICFLEDWVQTTSKKENNSCLLSATLYLFIIIFEYIYQRGIRKYYLIKTIDTPCCFNSSHILSASTLVLLAKRLIFSKI